MLVQTALALLPAPVAAQRVSLSATAGERTIVLDAASVPISFTASRATLLPAIQWQGGEGLWWSEIDLQAGRLGSSVRAILVRIDPKRFEFRLERRTRANRMTGAWTIDSASDAAVFAVNAGQFKETGPWGWLVQDGVEHRDPISAPLGLSIAFDTAGRVHWLRTPQLDSLRRRGGVRNGFQSFPLLLLAGRVPAIVRDPKQVDLGHRDARLVMAALHDGSLLFLLTRFAGLGSIGGRLPIGLTTPETILLVGALGARDAVMLDGGISAQMLLRPPGGAVQSWKGLRAVPLGLVAVPRSAN